MVEYQLPKLGVAGSIPVARFLFKLAMGEDPTSSEHTEEHRKEQKYFIIGAFFSVSFHVFSWLLLKKGLKD